MEQIEKKGLHPDEIIEWCMADGIAEALVNGEVMSRDEAIEVEDKIRQDRVEEVRTALGFVIADKHQGLQRELASASALSKRVNKFTYGHRSAMALPGYDGPIKIPEFSILTPNRVSNIHSLTKRSRSELRAQFEMYVPEAHKNILGRIAHKLYETRYHAQLVGFHDVGNGVTYDGAIVDTERYEIWKKSLGTETTKTFLNLLIRMTEGFDSTSKD